jgi:hypothetical protein
MTPWESFAFSTHFVEVDVLHFVDDFHLHEGYFRWGNICFCFGSFTMSFFGWPFRYGV